MQAIPAAGDESSGVLVKILVANKFGYLRGGLERVMFDEIDWLRAAGHEVELFATAHERNVDARFSAHFPAYREIGRDSKPTFDSVGSMFWNREAHDAMAKVIDEFRPDILHVHGIHRHLSPSVLSAARDAGVPSVMTAHDFNLICPQNVMLRGGRLVCQPRECGQVWFGACVSNRCVQNSLARSALGATELGFQRLRNAFKPLSAIITPSDFMARALSDGGVSQRFVVVRNAVAVNPSGKPSGSGMLVVGRLSPEKGVDVALEAARMAGMRLTVVGDGPLEPELRERFPEAEFTGHVGSARLAELRASARAVIVPSRCLENASMSVLEAMAAGVAVIASDIGGTSELVADDVSALLVAPGDTQGLSEAMSRLARDPELAARLGAAARSRAEREFAPASHVAGLVAVYESALAPTEPR